MCALLLLQGFKTSQLFQASVFAHTNNCLLALMNLKIMQNWDLFYCTEQLHVSPNIVYMSLVSFIVKLSTMILYHRPFNCKVCPSVCLCMWVYFVNVFLCCVLCFFFFFLLLLLLYFAVVFFFAGMEMPCSNQCLEFDKGYS